MWRKQYGNLLAQETAGNEHNLVVTSDSGVLMAGYQVFLDTNNDLVGSGYIIKTDKDGNEQWHKKYKRGPFQEQLLGILPNGDSNYVLMGNTWDYSDTLQRPVAWLIKINSMGDTIWQRTYKYYQDTSIDQEINPQDFIPMSDGGYLLTGYMIQHNHDGNAAWMLRVDSCGYFERDTTHAQFSYTQTGNNQIAFTNTTDKLCSWRWYFNDGDSSFAMNPNHQFADTGDYLITLITRAADFTDTARVWIHISAPNAVQKITSSSLVSVFPNPASENINFKIYLSPEQTETAIKIYNGQGELVNQFVTNAVWSYYEWNVKSVPAGIYFYEASGSQGILAKGKLVVQH